ncbi:hypothetical protein JCM19238_244 [Vibrio ponticus]|uniref:DUF2913 family protein n=1 Tax=Vibrio rhodolitus TaxID=2231649 RepID=UPI000502DAE6|nr:DUF2913 family protein [Vibrio rhodolitus]GAK82701.1 hypothetical protein JCM19238_244 [Vibrio ponticus]
MAEYTVEIQKLVNAALEDIHAEHQAKKLVNAPVANNNFMIRWVTKALKSQRFHRCVVDDLTRWQKAGRTKGNDSNLMFTFERISSFYRDFFPVEQDAKVIKDSDVEAFLDVMEQAGWEVSTSEPLVGVGKVQLFTEGQNSLALCSEQCEKCFDGELLVKPMNWFVRGNHALFVEAASKAGFMVHKVTDYKSNVKYHGEYIVFPENKGAQLAEIPISYQVAK